MADANFCCWNLYLTTTFCPSDQRRLRPVLPATRQDPKTHSACPQHKPRPLHQRHHLLQRRGRRAGRRLRCHHGDGLTSCSSSFHPPMKLEHAVLSLFFFCLRHVAPQLLPSPPNAASCWWKRSSIAGEFLKLSLEYSFNKLPFWSCEFNKWLFKSNKILILFLFYLNSVHPFWNKRHDLTFFFCLAAICGNRFVNLIMMQIRKLNLILRKT